MIIDVVGIDRDLHAALVRGFKRDGLEQPLHNGMQAAGTNILGILIDVKCDLRNAPDTAFGEFESHVLGVE